MLAALLKYITDAASTNMTVTIMFRQLVRCHLSPLQGQVNAQEKLKPLYFADLIYLIKASLKVGRMVVQNGK